MPGPSSRRPQAPNGPLGSDRRRTAYARGGPAALALAAFLPALLAAQDAYRPMVPAEGTRTFDIGAIAATVLIDETVLGGAELEMVRMVFPPGGPTTGGQHRHGRVEIFYVLEGVLEHEVNGESHRLEPGSVGVVRPEDTVAHRVLSEGPVTTLVIWAPGGELSRYDPSVGPGR